MARRYRDPEGRMALRAHIVELRNRVLISVVTLLLCGIAGWFFAPWVIQQLIEPLRELSDQGREATINYGTLTSAFDQRVRISLWLGVIASSPMWIYQAWAFITPGLTRKERWYALAFMCAAVPLFLGGVALAWAVVPNAVAIFVGFAPEESVQFLTADTYLAFITRTLLAFGVAFLSPVVMVALTTTGLVPGQVWRKGWRIAIIVAFAFGAIASPTPDVGVMFVLAAPMIFLYYVAVLVTWIVDRRRAKRLERDLGLDPDLDDDTASSLDVSAQPLGLIDRDIVDGYSVDGHPADHDPTDRESADRHSSHRHPADRHADAT